MTAGAGMGESPPAPLTGGLLRLAILLVLGLGRTCLFLALTVIERGGFTVLLHHDWATALQGGEIGFQGFAERMAVFRGIGYRCRRCGWRGAGLLAIGRRCRPG